MRSQAVQNEYLVGVAKGFAAGAPIDERICRGELEKLSSLVSVTTSPVRLSRLNPILLCDQASPSYPYHPNGTTTSGTHERNRFYSRLTDARPQELSYMGLSELAILEFFKLARGTRGESFLESILEGGTGVV